MSSETCSSCSSVQGAMCNMRRTIRRVRASSCSGLLQKSPRSRGYFRAVVATADTRVTARQMLNKVPEVTLYFWVIKVLCTTVGETASDYLSDNVGLGLTNTTFITGGLLIATLVFQFRARKYIPGIYWLGIVLISVVGTQITDNLTDNLGVSLVISTIAFAAALALAFATWFASERTLSIHTIFTTRRERSEEHTSELQSRRDLVCRLPLEKKKVIDTSQALLFSGEPARRIVRFSGLFCDGRFVKTRGATPSGLPGSQLELGRFS